MLHSWSLTVRPWKVSGPSIGKDRLPTTIFQGRAVKLRGCTWIILRSHPHTPRYPGPFTNSFCLGISLWGFGEVWVSCQGMWAKIIECLIQDEIHMCQGLNANYFHIVGDGHQPNSRGLIPIIRIPYRRLDDHPQCKELIDPGSYDFLGGGFITPGNLRGKMIPSFDDSA